ncbi:MAG: hypothetical protein ACK55I_37885, partial [bacterium]
IAAADEEQGVEIHLAGHRGDDASPLGQREAVEHRPRADAGAGHAVAGDGDPAGSRGARPHVAHRGGAAEDPAGGGDGLRVHAGVVARRHRRRGRRDGAVEHRERPRGRVGASDHRVG